MRSDNVTSTKIKCYLIIGKDYDKYLNLINLQCLKNSLKIIGILGVAGRRITSIDGIEALPVAVLSDLSKYDYAIVCNISSYSSITTDLSLQLNVPIEKFINVSVFDIPFFDIREYIQLKKNPPTIIADNCFGGITYHRLALPFYSPFINMWVPPNDFIKLMKNLKYYLKQKITLVKYLPSSEGDYPLVMLGDVTIHMNHYHSFDEAVQIWNKRLKRVNWDNILFIMRCQTEQSLKDFINVENVNKLAFTPFECEHPDVCYLPEWEALSPQYFGFFHEIELDYARHTNPVSAPINIVKKILRIDKGVIRRTTDSTIPNIDLESEQYLKSSGKMRFNIITQLLSGNPDESQIKTAISLLNEVYNSLELRTDLGKYLDYLYSPMFKKGPILHNCIPYSKLIIPELCDYLINKFVNNKLDVHDIDFAIELMRNGSSDKYPASWIFDTIWNNKYEKKYPLMIELVSNASKTNYELRGRLARAYRHGIGVEKNLSLAADIFYEISKKDVKWAIECFDCLWALGDPKYFEKMIEVIQPYVEGKKTDAIGRMGRAYCAGRGVEKNLVESAKWLRIAYQSSDFWANDLFDVLWNINTPETDAEMIRIITKNANLGDVRSMGRLGRAYCSGRGTPRDLDKSISWIKKAAAIDPSWKTELDYVTWLQTNEGRYE